MFFRLYHLLPILVLLSACTTHRLPTGLNEASGLFQMDDGTLYWLEDSGNPSMLYQTSPKAKLLSTLPVPAKNHDWEALTYDAETETWYIGDFGNNCNCRRDLKVYIWQPKTNLLDSIQFQYPDQQAFPPTNKHEWNFDCEAFYVHAGELHLFSKNRFKSNHFCKYYTLNATSGTQTAILQDSFYLKNSVVTDAVFNEKTGETTLLTYWSNLKKPYPKSAGYIHIFNSEFQKIKSIKLPQFLGIRQYECLEVLDNGDFIIANERRKGQRPKLRVIRRGN